MIPLLILTLWQMRIAPIPRTLSPVRERRWIYGPPHRTCLAWATVAAHHEQRPRRGCCAATRHCRALVPSENRRFKSALTIVFIMSHLIPALKRLQSFLRRIVSAPRDLEYSRCFFCSSTAGSKEISRGKTISLTLHPYIDFKKPAAGPVVGPRIC